MPLPMTTSRSRLRIIFMGLPSSDPNGAGEAGPASPPMLLDPGEAQKRDQRQQREDQEAGLIAAGDALRIAETGGEVEAADAAHHADQAGHHADLAAKALRHQ